MTARIDEIALDLYRISVYVKEFDLQFNHFLIKDDEPLAERERTVVLLTFYGERPSRDIAQTLGISEGNVRVIRSRAIERLRACMGAAERAS